MKNGEARNLLHSIAKNMMEDLKEFSNASVEMFDQVNNNMTQEYHQFLKHSCKLNI